MERAFSGVIRRKVCFYCISTHLGGAERSLLELLRGLKASAPQIGISVVVPKAHGPLLDEFRSVGIDYEVLAMPRSLLSLSRGRPLLSGILLMLGVFQGAFYFFKWVRWLRDHPPDLIYTAAIKCHFLGAIAGRIVSIPVIWHLRDILAPGKTLFILRKLSDWPGVSLIANSRGTARAFQPLGSGKPVEVIYNGLDPERYFPRPNRRFNLRFGVDLAVPVIGIVGVIARWKGQFEFIRMAKVLIDEGIVAQFVIVGEEIYDTSGERGWTRRLENEIDRLGLAEDVSFAGFAKDPAEAINGLDVLVHASILPEPFGRVIVEAMACGIAVIASRGGGVPELVEDGVHGLLFEPGNVSEMAEKARILLADPKRKAEMIAKARERFLDRFISKTYVDKMANALGGRGSGS